MDDFSKTDRIHLKECTACRGGSDPMTEPQLSEYLMMLNDEWTVVDGKRLDRTFKFNDFAEALVFTNKVGYLAEQQHHHPDIHLAWGKVKIELWTHKIGGLHENDFIMAAHIDHL